MQPPHAQKHLQLLINAGRCDTLTIGEPGAHGAAITGMHGIGVRTPHAAAVAEATVGFDIDWHMPKGRILLMGAKSMMFAANMFPTRGRVGSKTMRVPGAIPKLHFSIAPIVTNVPIIKMIIGGFYKDY